MSDSLFDILILIARPAAGKSEIIHFLKNTPLDSRRSRFHVGEIDEIDDFPMLWTWFEEDDLLTQMGQSRLHTTDDGSFRWRYLWDLLIRRISLEIHKHLRDNLDHTQSTTFLIEFARGKEHGGFTQAFQNLSDEVLQRAAIVYVQVSFTESLRKNRRRYNPLRPDSILEHGLSDEKMHQLYSEVDWQDLSLGMPNGYIKINNHSVPFSVFENEDDVTTPGGEAMEKRLEQVLGDLWLLYQP